MNIAVLHITETILRLPHGSTSGVLDFPSHASVLYLSHVSSCKPYLLFHLDPERKDWL